jgi:hypothetical protein
MGRAPDQDDPAPISDECREVSHSSRVQTVCQIPSFLGTASPRATRVPHFSVTTLVSVPPFCEA